MSDLKSVRLTEPQKSTFPVVLHRGEHEAIVLAEMLHSDVLLIDEQIGRTITLSRKLPLSGTRCARTCWHSGTCRRPSGNPCATESRWVLYRRVIPPKALTTPPPAQE